jgi:hypothetical protein
MFSEKIFAGFKRRFTRQHDLDATVPKPRVYRQELLGRYIRADVLIAFLKERFPYQAERNLEIEVCSLLQKYSVCLDVNVISPIGS